MCGFRVATSHFHFPRCCKLTCLDTSAHIPFTEMHHVTELTHLYPAVYETHDVFVSYAKVQLVHRRFSGASIVYYDILSISTQYKGV